jgi:tetratricopeptide (TPR) repeat protein
LIPPLKGRAGNLSTPVFSFTHRLSAVSEKCFLTAREFCARAVSRVADCLSLAHPGVLCLSHPDKRRFVVTVADRLVQDWLNGRASLGAAGGWTAEEIRLVADLGYALAEQGRVQEALTIFQGLAAVAPATAYFQSALGTLWLRMGEPARALEHLDAALGADPQDLAALVNRAEAHLQLGERQRAIRDLEAATDLGEALRDESAHLSLARARALLARLKQ